MDITYWPQQVDQNLKDREKMLVMVEDGQAMMLLMMLMVEAVLIHSPHRGCLLFILVLMLIILLRYCLASALWE